MAGNVFVAGYGDGALRVFDQREKPTTAMKQVWRSHKQWITNVHMQRGGMRELINALLKFYKSVIEKKKRNLRLAALKK